MVVTTIATTTITDARMAIDTIAGTAMDITMGVAMDVPRATVTGTAMAMTTGVAMDTTTAAAMDTTMIVSHRVTPRRTRVEATTTAMGALAVTKIVAATTE